MERCNYHVQFPQFIKAMRREARSEGYQVKCSHGGALQSLMHIMARDDLKQDRLDWLPRDIEVSTESDTIFFVGCAPYFDVVFRELDINTLEGVIAALRLLNRAHIPFKLLENERCCGHDLLLQGDREGFLALAQANLREFSRHGVKKIIINCPEGYNTIKVDYPKMLGETGIEVFHLLDVIAPLVQSGNLNPPRLEKRATYHDPCGLGRVARRFDEPRSILKCIPGLELVEMEQSRERALCCGASPWAHCGAVHRQIQEQRLDQAEAVGADLLVTACPKCQIHLRCAQRIRSKDSSQVELRDLASLLVPPIDD
jgi:Fe-S oxidoreductase